MSLNPAHGEVYLIHYVIKFVSDLWQKKLKMWKVYDIRIVRQNYAGHFPIRKAQLSFWLRWAKKFTMMANNSTNINYLSRWIIVNKINHNKCRWCISNLLHYSWQTWNWMMTKIESHVIYNTRSIKHSTSSLVQHNT